MQLALTSATLGRSGSIPPAIFRRLLWLQRPLALFASAQRRYYYPSSEQAVKLEHWGTS